jgi:hypothetical protein
VSVLRIVPDLDVLVADPSRVHEVSPDGALALLAEAGTRVGALQSVVALLAARAVARPSTNAGAETVGELHWLTPAEAAALAGVPVRTVYSWSRRLDWRPFVRRLSRKLLRIEEHGLRKWLDRSKPLQVPRDAGRA